MIVSYKCKNINIISYFKYINLFNRIILFNKILIYVILVLNIITFIKNMHDKDELDQDSIFINPTYISRSSSLISGALRKGYDVAQLSNGDIIVSEVRVINIKYIWSDDKKKMIKKRN